MRCLICNKECINEEMNICSGYSTSGIEYKQELIRPKKQTMKKIKNKNI